VDAVTSWLEWSDEEFLSYVESHCETPRALFSMGMIERLHELAGVEFVFHGARPVVLFMPADTALPLVGAARERLADAGGSDGT